MVKGIDMGQLHGGKECGWTAGGHGRGRSGGRGGGGHGWVEVVEDVVDGMEVVLVVDGGEVVVVVKRQLVGEVVVVVQERVEVEDEPNQVLFHGSQLIQERTPFLPHFL